MLASTRTERHKRNSSIQRDDLVPHRYDRAIVWRRQVVRGAGWWLDVDHPEVCSRDGRPCGSLDVILARRVEFRQEVQAVPIIDIKI